MLRSVSRYEASVWSREAAWLSKAPPSLQRQRRNLDRMPSQRPKAGQPKNRVKVSEGGLEPPRPYRALGPQPSASTNSATPTE